MSHRDDWTRERAYWVSLGFVGGVVWTAFFLWIVQTGPAP